MTEVALCGDVSDQLREVAAFGAVVSISIDEEQPETVELVALSILVILYA